MLTKYIHRNLGFVCNCFQKQNTDFENKKIGKHVWQLENRVFSLVFEDYFKK